MNNKNKIPRRCLLDLNIPAEIAIYNAIQEVEKIGADVRLTNIVVELIKLKDLLSDYIDDDIASNLNTNIDYCRTEGLDTIKKSK